MAIRRLPPGSLLIDLFGLPETLWSSLGTRFLLQSLPVQVSTIPMR